MNKKKKETKGNGRPETFGNKRAQHLFDLGVFFPTEIRFLERAGPDMGEKEEKKKVG